MRISFDLDDTLICYEPMIPRELDRVPPWWKWKYCEPLRLGTVDLHRQLIARGHEVWIYTTSYRHPRDVARWLDFYGIRVSSVINAETHARICGAEAREFSKLPARFDIALHVDDEVRDGWGERFGFRWLTIARDDINWAAKVLAALDELEMPKPIENSAP